jgi:hypothetical protein
LASVANATGNSQQGSGTEELLPLDVPERVICAQRRDGHIYRHVFRRIAAADWKGFFGNVRMEFTEGAGAAGEIVGMDTSSLQLYSDAILRVEGFEMPDGRKPDEQPDWPRCIPRGGRLTAVDLLMKVTRDAKEKAVVADAKGLSVRVDALWNEYGPGSMKQYFGLVHRFRRPTAEHLQLFGDAGRVPDSMMLGTGRGKAVLPSSNAILIELYDELIEMVDGYSIAGVALGSREQIAREMDSIHKAVSVTAIFPASVGLVN